MTIGIEYITYNIKYGAPKTVNFRLGNVIEYGQCSNTDTIGISETINPTKNT